MKKKCDFDCENCPYDDCVSDSTQKPYDIGAEKQRYSHKAYYKKNRDKLLSDAKEYYQNHKEERKKKALDYYYAHREEIAKKRREKRLCK